MTPLGPKVMTLRTSEGNVSSPVYVGSAKMCWGPSVLGPVLGPASGTPREAGVDPGLVLEECTP